MAPPPPLVEELVEELLLRFPPDDPARLVHASLVCKLWCRLISAPGFRRRFLEFHRVAPMLGFLCNLMDDSNNTYIARFIRTSSSCPPHADRRNFALDARHGRVLLYSRRPLRDDDPGFPLEFDFVVWDPVTDQQRELPMLNWFRQSRVSWNAAVLCAAAAKGGTCDHLDCHGGPFSVVFVGIMLEHIYAYVYSSETGAWSTVTTGHLGPLVNSYVVMGPSLLVGDTLHFALEDGRRILTYDLGEHGLSVLTTPSAPVGNMDLVTSEDGGLGVAGVDGYNIRTWSWKDGSDGQGCWKQGRVVELDMMLSISIGNPLSTFHLVGFAEGADTIFLSAHDGVFAVEMRSGRIKKVREKGHFYGIVPYVSFYTPDLPIGRLQPRVG